LMQENHSFDSYFGRLMDAQFYGSQVDGVDQSMVNFDGQGRPVYAHRETELCVADPKHDWNSMHQNWNQGRNDGFSRINAPSCMGHYNEQDLAFYYGLANQFAIADRYFASVLANTLPNRFFLMTGTAFGQTESALPTPYKPFRQKTIFEVFNRHQVSWKYYKNGPGYLALFPKFYLKNLDKIKNIGDFDEDLRLGLLPQVVFIDSGFDGLDEHPESNVQLGQRFVANRIRALMKSSYWKKAVLFLAYDEGGGFYDHVPPPAACKPDEIPPKLKPNSYPGQYDRYGFRVPFVAVSPFVKHHYVSHQVYDHTSILKFIETKFNLPALTARDANADAMMDLFDFSNPIWKVDSLPSAAVDPARRCE
jgi:phospholipase C